MMGMKTKAARLVARLAMLYFMATVIKISWQQRERVRMKHRSVAGDKGMDKPPILQPDARTDERSKIKRTFSIEADPKLRKSFENNKPQILAKHDKLVPKNFTLNDKKGAVDHFGSKTARLEENSEPNTTISDIPMDLLPILENLLRRDFAPNDSCKKGYFRIKGMDKCRPWLTCKEINNHKVLVRGRRIGGGIGKLVHYGTLQGKYYVAVSENREKDWLRERVMAGNRNLIMLQPSPYALQVLGFCENPPNSTVITESCKTCSDLSSFMQTDEFKKLDAVKRFEFAIKIVGSFDYLHHGLGLPRVHCDLHTADEAFKQYIVTEDRKVFMGDVDELPQVDKKNGNLATCKEESRGIMKTPEFIAPEQRYTKIEFRRKLSQKPVDEKSDIWKLPDLTNFLMGETEEKPKIFRKLKKIHDQCKQLDPRLRPTAREVLIEYLTTLRDIQK